MFPGYDDNILYDSDFFFEMGEVPPYYEIPVSGTNNLNSLYNEIKAIGNNCTGIIEPDKISFHLIEGDRFYIDYNKEFGFVYINGQDFTGYINYSVLLRFLQFKVKKFMFVFEDMYIYIEKTENTYDICLELYNIYLTEDFFYENIISMVKDKDVIEKCYLNLLIEYLKIKDIPGFTLKDDFDILTKVLQLRVA